MNPHYLVKGTRCNRHSTISWNSWPLLKSTTFLPWWQEMGRWEILQILLRKELDWTWQIQAIRDAVQQGQKHFSRPRQKQANALTQNRWWLWVWGFCCLFFLSQFCNRLEAGHVMLCKDNQSTWLCGTCGVILYVFSTGAQLSALSMD